MMRVALICCVILYLVGLIGLNSVYREYFIRLTPFNLLMTFLFLVTVQKPRDYRFLLIFLVVSLGGFFIEVLGVQTGWIFGTYTYEVALGPKILETPPLIGINWFLLTFCSVMLVRRFTQDIWLIAPLAALLMVVMDFMIEPVAMQNAFWSWQGHTVPPQNYIAWFFVSLVFTFFTAKMSKHFRNPLAPWVYVIQFIFFACMLILAG